MICCDGCFDREASFPSILNASPTPPNPFASILVVLLAADDVVLEEARFRSVLVVVVTVPVPVVAPIEISSVDGDGVVDVTDDEDEVLVAAIEVAAAVGCGEAVEVRSCDVVCVVDVIIVVSAV